MNRCQRAAGEAKKASPSCCHSLFGKVRELPKLVLLGHEDQTTRLQSRFRVTRPSRLALLLLVCALLAALVVREAVRQWHSALVTVILTPRSQIEQASLQSWLDPEGVDPRSQQRVVRLLTVASLPQSAILSTASTFPVGHASGQLTFINNGATDVTLPSLTIPTKSGLQIAFPGPITIPAAAPASVIITGYALTPGPAGTFPALSVVQPCCAAHIFVKNTSAFLLRDQPVTQLGHVQQSEIDQEVTLIADALKQDLHFQIAGQYQRGEHPIPSSWQCQPALHAEPHAGTKVRRFMVRVMLTCHESVSNERAVQVLAGRLLQAQAPQSQAAYQLEKLEQVTVIHLNNHPQRGINLTLLTQGQWIYRFSQAQLHHLASLIAGHTLSSARGLLLQQEGIAHVSLQAAGRLPANPGFIRIVVSPDV